MGNVGLATEIYITIQCVCKRSIWMWSRMSSCVHLGKVFFIQCKESLVKIRPSVFLQKFTLLDSSLLINVFNQINWRQIKIRPTASLHSLVLCDWQSMILYDFSIFPLMCFLYMEIHVLFKWVFYLSYSK